MSKERKESDDTAGCEDGRCLLVMGAIFLIVGLCCLVAGAVVTGIAYSSAESGTSLKHILGPIALGVGAVGVIASIAYTCFYCRSYDDDYNSGIESIRNKTHSFKSSGISGHNFVPGGQREYLHVHHPPPRTHSPNTSQETLSEEDIHDERPRGRHRGHHFRHTHSHGHGQHDGEQLFREVAALEQYLSNNPDLRKRWEEMAARLRCRPQMTNKLVHFRQKLAVDPEALARLVNVMKAYVEDPDECEYQIVDLVNQYNTERPSYRRDRRASFPPPPMSSGQSVFVADHSPYVDTSYSPSPPPVYSDRVYPGTAAHAEMAYPAATAYPQDVFWLPTSFPVIWGNDYPSECYA